ncbi:tape measure protein [Enterococcus faecalis]|uniref:tape measure protein n=1 Tax=Enterococcus faecalis TaxID=1351 RepID=UPI0022243A7A|nr:tape measure protein [Enterococcus faecalis]UYY37209.1 tape measure protein [Enterococcus faecalis]UYY40026.1 tape measure protein [Enterococcus faecalis]HCR3094720.1 tape measure protein [Enterococcus faecalis]HCR3970600.1 tape measure protein [Enterococcus faecalis]
MILDESGFSQGLNSAVKKLQGFDGEVDRTGQKGGRSLGSIWTSFVGNFLASGATKIISKGIGLITSNIDGAINRVDTLNNANRVFENMGFSAGETSKTMDSLKKSIQGLPTPLDSAIKGVQLIASSTNDLGKSEQIFAALNNGILGFGGSAEMVDNAIIQLSQSFSNGKVDAQTWNSMINSGLGPALNALAKQMGLTAGQMKEGLSDGSISVEEFQDSLIKLNKEGGGGLKSLEQIAKDSTAGIKTGLANMKTAIVRGVANVVTKIDEGLKSAGFGSISEIIADKGAKMEAALTKFAEMIPPMIKTVKTLYDTLKPYAPLLAGLAGSIGTLMLAKKVSAAFTAWQKATEGLSIAQAILNSTMLANPFVAILAAVVGLVTGFIYLWKTNEGFRDAVKNIWKNIQEVISSAADVVVKAWDSTMEFFSNMWDGTKEAFSNAGTWMKEAPGNAADWIKNKWNGTKEFFSGLWDSTKEGLKNTWENIKQGAADSAKSVGESFKNGFDNAKDWFKGIGKSISDVFTTAFDFVWKYIGPLVTGVKNAFLHMSFFLKNLWKNLVNIGENLFTILKNVILAPILFVTSMITGGWEEAKENMIAVWNNITEAASEIWNSITSIISNYLLNMRMAVLNIWIGLKTSIITIWTDLSAKAGEIWTNITAFFSQTWENIKQTSAQTWENIKQTAINIWEGLKIWFFTTIDNIKNGVIDGWNNLKQGTIDTFNATVQWSKDTWTNFKQWIVDLVVGIKDGAINGWENLKQGTINTFNNMVQGAKNAWNNLTRSVSDTVSNVKQTFEDLKHVDLFEIGQNIIQGLINGITDKFNKLKETMFNMADNIKKWTQKQLRIFSPSRWMRDMIGKNIVLGVVAGIDQEKGTLDKSVKKMTDLPTELPDFSVTGRYISQKESQASKSDKNNSNATTTFGGDTFNINLQAMGELDDKQLMSMAQKLVKYIQVVKNRDSDAVGGAFGGI